MCHYLVGDDDREQFLAELRYAAGIKPLRTSRWPGDGELAPSHEQIRSAIKSGCSRCRKCPTPSIIWNDDPGAGK